jgi:hypothetical protein
MKKIVKLTESDLARIVKRVIKEEEENIPDCSTKLQTTDEAGQPIVGSRRLQLPDGEMKIVYAGSGRPDTRGYLITINETPFCKIPNM